MLTGISAGLAAGALWGLTFVAPRMTPGLSAVDLAAGRYLSYGAVAAIAMLLTLRTRQLPTPMQALAAVGMSFLGNTGYYLLLVLAVANAGSEVPALIVGLIPLWMMLLGKPAGLKWAALLPGLVLTASGLALMMGTQTAAGAITVDVQPHLQPHLQPHFWRGIALAVAAMALWTAYGVLNSAWLKRHPTVSATDWANWQGVATGLGALGLWWLAGSASNTLLALDNRALFAIVCIATGIGSAWLATILWNIASQRLSASLCGQLIVSETIFALVYSYAWDAQWPSHLQLAACALFVLGILASIRAHR
jgi:drug/metabolite transporter (DMT)-like permease